MSGNSLKIAYLNNEQKVWFIRANSGTYANNFKFGEMIAIKHLEDALGDKIGDTLPSEEDIRDALLKNEKYFEFIEDNKTKKDKKTLNRAGNILLSQIRRFAHEIKAGDIIVTKNELDGYNIGICSSDEAYIDHKQVELPRENPDEPKGPVLKHKLRKKVVWGPSIKGVDLPHTVRRATRGQQTITNLSDHKVKIFHLIYPFFTDGEHLYFSNKIRKRGDINALVVGKLFENISLAEKLIQTLTSAHDEDIENLATQLTKAIFSEGSFVACQAEFMSPGDVWCKIPLSATKALVPQLAAGVLVCLLLTGQAEAIQLNSVDDISPNAVAELQANENSPSTTTMFEEKFQAAQPSTALKNLSDRLKSKSAEIENLETSRSTKEIRDNLKLDMTSVETKKLEKFDYGINVIELRRLNESH